MQYGAVRRQGKVVRPELVVQSCLCHYLHNAARRVTAGDPCSAKTPSQLISLDFWGSGLHPSGMKILLVILVVQSLNLVIFAWFNRVAGLRIRVHQGLNGIPDPDPALAEPKPSGGRLLAIPVLNGLHHDYRLAA